MFSLTFYLTRCGSLSETGLIDSYVKRIFYVRMDVASVGNKSDGLRLSQEIGGGTPRRKENCRIEPGGRISWADDTWYLSSANQPYGRI